jgi:hypothetical protein
MTVNREFPIHAHDFAHDRWSIRRYKITLAFLEKYIPKGSSILDLGTTNGLGNFMAANGFKVHNTHGQDFDTIEIHECMMPESEEAIYYAVTSFEIFEHLINPLGILTSLPADRLVASVPLRLWFAKSFKNKTNPAGWHFHEFEKWQFDWLLEKAGWKILARETHTSPTFRLGFRSILRWITPRIYLVYAERI